jgi:hypothetical protein
MAAIRLEMSRNTHNVQYRTMNTGRKQRSDTDDVEAISREKWRKERKPAWNAPETAPDIYPFKSTSNDFVGKSGKVHNPND